MAHSGTGSSSLTQRADLVRNLRELADAIESAEPPHILQAWVSLPERVSEIAVEYTITVQKLSPLEQMPRDGDKAVCRNCGSQITFSGTQWRHLGSGQPRHPAIPKWADPRQR